ncbi:unnamed protein product, partial [Polarella glacialis]
PLQIQQPPQQSLQIQQSLQNELPPQMEQSPQIQQPSQIEQSPQILQSLQIHQPQRQHAAQGVVIRPRVNWAVARDEAHAELQHRSNPSIEQQQHEEDPKHALQRRLQQAWGRPVWPNEVQGSA